jgi:hypothetical protein
MFEYPKIHEIRSASDMVHPASTPENPITAAYVLVIRDRSPEGYIDDEFLDWNYILWWRRNYALNRELCLALRTETLVLRNSAENMFLGYRSEKAPELFVFPASRSTPLLQHPHLPSAIGCQDAVRTRQERATRLQSIPNTSSSRLAI